MCLCSFKSQQGWPPEGNKSWSLTTGATTSTDCWLQSCQVPCRMGRLDDTYWICAAVNQHASICHRNPYTYDRDPLTKLLHPVCNCSCINISDPDGRSVKSEINKFDDMMSHLAATGKCRHVIAVDQSLDQLCTPKQKRGEAQIRLIRRQFWLSSKTTCLIVFQHLRPSISISFGLYVLNPVGFL